MRRIAIRLAVVGIMALARWATGGGAETGGASVAVAQRTPVPTVQPGTPTPLPDGWRQYTNRVQRYSIAVPTSWTEKRESAREMTWVSPERERYILISVQAIRSGEPRSEPVSFRVLSAYLYDMAEDYGYRFVERPKQLTLGSSPAAVAVYDEDNEDFMTRHYVMDTTSTRYTYYLWVLGDQDNEDVGETFRTVLASFTMR